MSEEVLTWNAPGIITPFGTHYILEGGAERPLVLCIHGIGCYYFYFDGLAKALVASGYRVLRYDLIGRGFSQPAEAYDRDSHLKQLRDLLQHLELAPTRRHVIGHSMGGALALLHADEDPEHISSLTLLAPAGLMDGAIFTFLRSCACLHGMISYFLRKGQEAAWRADFHGKDAGTVRIADDAARHLRLMHANNPHAQPAIFQSIVRFPLSGLAPDVRRVAARLAAPVLVYWGDADTVVPTRELERWRAALTSGADARARAEFELMPAAGHAFFLEQPAAAAARVLRFIAAADAQAA